MYHYMLLYQLIVLAISDTSSEITRVRELPKIRIRRHAHAPVIGHYLGCYAYEDIGSANYFTRLDMKEDNSVEKCKARCITTDDGNLFAAMMKKDCFCAALILAELNTMSKSECDADCPGDNAAKCGGIGNSLYSTRDIPFGEICMEANQCVTTGSTCTLHRCACNMISTYDRDTDSCLPAVSLQCHSNCYEVKNPLKKVKFYIECEKCNAFTVSNYQWSIKVCSDLDIKSCEDVEKTMTGDSANFTFEKEMGSESVYYGAFVSVIFTDGSEKSADVLFQYSPVPTAGTCNVEPHTGYMLLTNFLVTCTGFTAQKYKITYKMKSNTKDTFIKGSILYTGAESSLTGLKLFIGDAANDYKLYIIIMAAIESGAYVTVSTHLQVRPLDMAPEGISMVDAVSSLIDVTNPRQSSTIADLLDSGNQEKAVQYLSIISSTINFTTDNNANKTDDRTQIRTAVVACLGQVITGSYDAVNTVVQVLNDATLYKLELSESTQDLAMDLYDNLVDSMSVYSNVSSSSDVTDLAGELLTGVTRLLDILVDEGTSQLFMNKTDNTSSVLDDSKMEKLKLTAGKLLTTVNKISSVLLTNQIAGDNATIVQTDTVMIRVEKMQKHNLIGHKLTTDNNGSRSVTAFRFPSVLNGLEKEASDVGVQMIHMKRNPYMWDKSAKEVNMEVLSVDLTLSNSSVVSVTNLSEPVQITLASPRVDAPPNSTLLLYVVKTDNKLTFNLSQSNMLTFTFPVQDGKTTVLSINPLSKIRKFKIYIKEAEKGTFDEVVDFGVTYPDQTYQLNEKYAKFHLSNDTIEENSSNIYFTFNNQSEANYTGIYYLTVSVDLDNNSTLEDLQDLEPECVGNETVVSCDAKIEIALEVNTISQACMYWDIPSQQWSTDGCEVSPRSTLHQLECLCTHLTVFAGGLFVLPNVVDPIDDVALFLTFFDNPVIVTAVLIVWMLYFFLIHWARQADRKDQERVGVIAVDADTQNHFRYLVCVVTGWWADAGTTANVFFYMKGSNGSSKRCKLATPLRQCFQSGFEDWFLVSTEESIGDLHDVTLWHDNSGANPSWYLSQVYIKDLQNKSCWTFIYNDWMAVDCGSSRHTSATILAVTKEELKLKQKHNFVVKWTQDLRDNHLWISIFSKPARSTFTRVQRVTCALSLLLTTMLCDIMFYGIPTDDPEDQVGGPRGVVISASSIVIGIQSSLIMFPVNVVFMQLFQRLKQRERTEDGDQKTKSHLIDQASNGARTIFQKALAGIMQLFQRLKQRERTEEGDQKTNYHLQTLIDQGSNGARTIFQMAFAGREKNVQQPTTSASACSQFVVLSETKQTGKYLLWWFLYIIWFLVISVCIVSSYFVMLYGLKYGYNLSVQWLVSFLSGFSQSACIMQPSKVLGMAVVLTLVLKKTVEFEDYGPEVRIDEDEVYANDSHIPYSQPLSANLLKKKHDIVHLEWLMNITLRDMILYIVYFCVVGIMVHGDRDIQQAYRNSQTIRDVLVNTGCIAKSECFYLGKVDNVDTFYQYIDEVAIPQLADMTLGDREYATPDSSHFMIGPWRLRQLRVDQGSCGANADKVFRRFNMNVPECTGPYWLGDAESRHFNGSWANPLTEPSDPSTPWTHHSAWNLRTIPIKGNLATYSGAGYMLIMPTDPSQQKGIMRNMWNSDWIDEKTRAVFLEFTLYNPNANLFSVVVLLFEFSNNGAVMPYHEIYSTKLYHYSTNIGIFVAVCEFLFLIFNIGFVIIEYKKYDVLGIRKYFDDFWSYIELIQMALSFTVIGLFFQRLISVGSVMNGFKESDGSSFISFYTAISWDFILGHVMAFLVALIMLKAIKLLKFNKRTYMVADVLKYTKSMIINFFIMCFVVVAGFGHFATMAFGKHMKDYRDMLTSLNTIFNFSLGISDLPGLQEASRILGPIYFVAFISVVMFIFMTMFVAILNFGINEAKVKFDDRRSKFNLIEYVIKRLKTVANIR